MKILVAVKRVVDHNVRIRLKPDGTGVITDGVKFSLNPFDEIALEEALRLREGGFATEVIACSLGTDTVVQQLRTALAMGADRAVHVQTDQSLEPLDIARVLHRLCLQEQVDLALLGKLSIDDDNGQTGAMLAGLWDRPQATFASRLDVVGRTIRVEREIDSGLETLTVHLPAVITADLRLNEPRYAKLPDILKAKKKPIESTSLDDLGVTASPSSRTLAVTAPPDRPAGRTVASPKELVDELVQRGLL